MKDVLTLPLIEKGSDIHFFCTLLLDQKSKREMYNTLEDAETKWKWLQFHFSLWTNDMNVVQRMIWDDDDDEVWQTTTYAVDIICSYYLSYIHKEPCMDSFHTGLVWLQEIMRGNERRCVNLFRMDKDTLIKLCLDLECHYKLKCSKKMTILEKVGMFLYVLALGASNRQVQERFQHSGETVSRNFHEVLKAMLCLSIDMIKPTDPTFSNIPPEILNDDRYMPHFKVYFSNFFLIFICSTILQISLKIIKYFNFKI
ncbi:uncharacterized protein LOC110662822 [Hevea brasiliensis]|uniref:uncharacterized protein LOC110662822 n=1 Tax=Hevea brasiliensis TaxID=3981 RepID=UPI0025E55C57|nr:uncharacterized protein LOC110662822 [Hevea brasiliensis]